MNQRILNELKEANKRKRSRTAKKRGKKIHEAVEKRKQDEIKQQKKIEKQQEKEKLERRRLPKTSNKERQAKRERDRKYYETHREEKIQKVLDRYYTKKADKDAFAEQYPDRMEYIQEANLQRLRNKWIKIKNRNNPEDAYMDTYWKIILAPDATHPLLSTTREECIIDLDEVVNQLELIRKAKRRINSERRTHLRKAWELDLPVKDYIDTIKALDAERDKERKREQSLKDFLINSVPAEELRERIEIQTRLEELNKLYPRYNPEEEAEDTHEYVIKEIKEDMAKISFDKGKTYLDILDDKENNIILGKIAKKKIWQSVVDAFDADAMMATLEKMSANERKMCTQANNADNRMLYLGKYLLEATEDLIV